MAYKKGDLVRFKGEEKSNGDPPFYWLKRGTLGRVVFPGKHDKDHLIVEFDDDGSLSGFTNRICMPGEIEPVED